MKITINSIDNYESEATITFDAAELEKTKSRASKQLASRTTFPGFRKGKVPPAKILEQYFGKGAILDEAADILIRQGANDVLKTMTYVPVTEMKPEIITCEEGKDFVFKLTYTPYPKVELGEYKGLDVEKVVEPVTDEKVEHQIEHVLDNNSKLVDAEEGATVADGDFITLDYVGTVDGEKFAGGEGKDRPLEIGSHTFIDDFEEQLIGLKVGDEKDVKVTFPEGYHAKDLAEKPAVFHCKINSIKHKEIPELNEELVKKVSKFETVEEFKDSIRKNLEAVAERDALVKQREEVVQKAVDNMTVDLPPVMIENRIDQLINELEANLQVQGLKLEVYLAANGKTLDELREDYRDGAKKDLLIDIMLEEVGRLENIQVDEKDINMEIAVMASMYRATPKQIVKALRDNGQIQNVISNVRHKKAMQFIFENMAGAKSSDETSDAAVAETSTEKVDAEKVEDKVSAKKVDDKVDNVKKTSAIEKVDDVEKVDAEKSDAKVAEKADDVAEKSDSAVDKNANA